jgi:mono/diheme cytochrome c family protein
MICHGENGLGTEDGPALNDPARLKKFDDAWYRNVIAYGRPAKGMPTWGTVLSPAQIHDVVALLAVWREGGTVSADIPLAAYLANALFALQGFDDVDAEYFLDAALAQADSVQAKEIHATIDLIRQNRLFEANARLTTLLPPAEMGKAAYQSNCAGCHGTDGTGDTGPSLRANSYIQAQSDEDLIAFMLIGRKGTAMDAFEGILTEEALSNIVALLRTWQE